MQPVQEGVEGWHRSTNLERVTALVGSVLGLEVPPAPSLDDAPGPVDGDAGASDAAVPAVRPHLIETLLERDVRRAVDRRNRLDGLASLENPRDMAHFDANAARFEKYARVAGTSVLPGKNHRNLNCRALSRFAGAMRSMRREGTLPDDKVAALDGLGFDWMIEGRGNAPAVTFEEGLEELRKFVAENGHCRPTLKKTGNKALCDFVTKCRKSWKKGNAHFMATRFKPLDVLGFQVSLFVCWGKGDDFLVIQFHFASQHSPIPVEDSGQGHPDQEAPVVRQDLQRLLRPPRGLPGPARPPPRHEQDPRGRHEPVQLRQEPEGEQGRARPASGGGGRGGAGGVRPAQEAGEGDP